MSNPTGKGGFQERKHQINRKGRPKNFDSLRDLMIALTNEVVEEDDGTRRTRVEKIARDWLESRNFQKQKAALEVAFGKVPDEVNLGGKTLVELVVKYAENPDGAKPSETA